MADMNNKNFHFLDLDSFHFFSSDDTGQVKMSVGLRKFDR